MSRFYGRVTGASGISSRRSTGKHGISAHISGWNKGVKVEGFVDGEGNDCFSLFETGGSNNPERTKMIGQVTDIGGGDYERKKQEE